MAIAGAIIVTSMLSALQYRSRVGSSGAPRRSGTALLPGLSAAVQIRFDGFGVPSIAAGSEEDLLRALGYVHANDRLFQMELFRRTGQGRTAEWFGEAALGWDRHLRSFRLVTLAEADWELLPPDTRARLSAYSEGVNAFIAERQEDLPPEYRVLRVLPEAWKPSDCLLVLRALWVMTGIEEVTDETHYRWLRAFGPEAVRALLEASPQLPIHPVIEARARADQQQGSHEKGTREDEPLGIAFAAGPPGKTLLAGSTFGGLFVPGPFYEVRLHSPGLEVAGLTPAGVPLFATGQTRNLAWTLEGTRVDVQDLLFEELSADGKSVRRGNGFVPLKQSNEVFYARGGRTEEATLSWTEMGPFRSDSTRGLPPRSLAWSVLTPVDAISGMWALLRATKVSDAADAVKATGGLIRTLLLADRGGACAALWVGSVPESVATGRMFPLPAWEDVSRWRAVVPAGKVAVPETGACGGGFLSGGNGGAPGPLAKVLRGSDSPSRRQYLRDLLQRLPPSSSVDAAGMQGDVTATGALSMVHGLLSLHPVTTADTRPFLDILQGWDGRAEGAGGAAYALVEEALLRSVFADEARASHMEPFATPRHLERLLSGELSRWWDDVSTPKVEQPQEIVSKALADAVAQGRKRLGADLSQWRLETLQRWEGGHPLAHVGFWGALFEQPAMGLPGSWSSLWHVQGSHPPGVDHALTGRFIANLENPDLALAGLWMGQSGHPRDPHFDDQRAFGSGQLLHRVPFSETAVGEATRSMLTLKPDSPSRGGR